MYRITRNDGAVLYDVSYPDDYIVTEPKATYEIGQAGSLRFTLVPEHSMYNQVGTMETYVVATKENTEIFYGRIIDINVDETTGIKEIECAGALQFLEDGEIPPVQNSEAQEGEDKGVEMTAAAFFSFCISSFNSDIGGDSKRTLQVGTVSHSKAGTVKSYNIGNYTQVKSALDSNLISEYGGYFRVRKSGNTHVIDWLENYSEPNSSPIKLRENVLNQENAISSTDFITLIRPIGKENLTLPEGTVAVSDSLVSKYGRIIQTVNFGEAETVADLRSKAYEYISRIGKGLGMTATVKLIDMHVLNNTISSIYLGSTYTNISGFEGEEMVVSGMELNFVNPADDSITLKNKKELLASQQGGTSGRGSLSKIAQDATNSNSGFQNIWKHITETEDSLTLHAKLISINAERLVETATEFERYSRVTDETIQTMDGEVHTIQGTGVFQNNDRITQIAGSFSIRYFVVPKSQRDKEGASPNRQHWYVFSPHVVTEGDVNSGKEFFGSDEAALAGISLPTASLTVGSTVYQMVLSSDQTPVQGTTYYTKGLALGGGAELTITEEGNEITVGKEVGQVVDGVQTIRGSALWTMKDDITGVVGQFEIEEDEQGNRKLVIVNGGGLSIKENGVEYGVYNERSLSAGVIAGKINDDPATKINFTNINSKVTDYTALGLYNEDTLTAGILVTKINDGSTDVLISGDRVNINASQVKIGPTEKVSDWISSTGQDISRIEGLVADQATIDQILTNRLNAVTARIESIEADFITTEDLSAADVRVASLYSAYVDSEAVDCMTIDCAEINGTPADNYLTNAVVSGTGANKTLRIYNAAGTEVATFSKAAPVLSGEWSSNVFTVSAGPDDGVSPIVETFSTSKGTGEGTDGGLVTLDTFSDNHKAYAIVSATRLPIPLYRIVADATSEYRAGTIFGHMQGDPISGAVAGKTQTTNPAIYDFTVNRRDGEKTTLSIDCSSIFTAAREGYTLGTFTQATVTLQPSASIPITPIKNTATVRINPTTVQSYHEGGTDEFYARGDPSPTAYPVVSSGGTIYYQSSGETTYYAAGSTTVYDRGTGYYLDEVGTSFSLTFGSIYDKNGKFIGARYYTNTASGQTTLYAKKSTRTFVYPGNGGTYTAQGEEKKVTPIKTTTAIRLGSSTTYYKGNGGKKTAQGAVVSAYKAVTSGGTVYYQADTKQNLYAKGTTDSTTYYTKE